jgi:hypothetical protein
MTLSLSVALSAASLIHSFPGGRGNSSRWFDVTARTVESCLYSDIQHEDKMNLELLAVIVDAQER